MSGNNSIFRLIGVLLLLGLIVAGGFMAYRAGIAQGVAQAPDVARAIQQAGGNGQPLPPMYGPYGYGYPYGYGFGYHHFFNPFGAICVSILFFFLFLAAIRMIFFRRMGYGWGRHWHEGRWGNGEGGAPAMFNEWHKRAHGEGPAAETDKEE
jgi:hypothetical protein